MKQGLTLTALVDEVARIERSKRDLVVDTRHLMLSTQDSGSFLTVVGASAIQEGSEFRLREYAHNQLADHTKVPLPFYRRLRSAYPDVLDTTVNRILHQENARRMIRTIDGEARALLSDRYRRLDNFDLVQAVVPTLNEILGGGSGVQDAVASCDLTETKLYLSVVFPMFEAEIKVGEPVRLGVRISNSEIGAGSCSIETILFVLSCTNGMTTPHSIKRNHVGRRAGETEDFSVYSDETLRLDDAAFFAKVKDSVKACADEARFQQIVSEMRKLTETEIEADPIQAVEVLANRHDLTGDEQGGVLRHLIAGADLTPWGYVNAITRAAQDVDSYDRSMELERLGGKLAADPALIAA